MGAAIEKTLIFPAPEPLGECASLVWDEQPRSTPGGGAKRPFLWIPALQDDATTIIHFHANAEDLFLIEDHLRRLSMDLQANVLGVEYPGYGQLDGTPTLASIDAVAAHALQYVVLTRGVPPAKVVLYGRSLGCGPALRLARRAREIFRWGICGLVLQSPFISVKQLATDYIGIAASMVVPECYDNLEELQQLCSKKSSYCPVDDWIPLLLVHGKKDSVVRPYHSETLHRAAIRHGHPAAELSLCNEATHDSWNMRRDLIQPMLDFLHRHPGPKVKDAKVMPRHLNCSICSVDDCREGEAASAAMAPVDPVSPAGGGRAPGAFFGLGSLIPSF